MASPAADRALPTPTTEAGRAGLAALLAEPGRALLGLDFDGTLSPIVPDPAQARAHPAIPPVLRRLGPRLGGVAVVTGRPAAVAVEYGDLAAVEGLVVLGHYGLERWQAGRTETPPSVAGVQLVRDRLPEVLAAAGAPPGTYVEDKGQALAVHVRRTADPPAALAAVEPRLRELVAQAGLVVEPGRLVLELRPAGADKGAALRELVEADPAGPPSAVVFVGDDLGDLPAFTEVQRLRDEGVPGLLVCSGSTEVVALADRADLVVDGPAGVAALLQALVDALAGD
jgi:trehalose 6-phosphate phosphatase